MAGDYEEKYLLLRDENTALKKKKNEQEATIKRMFTKIAIIEEALKKKRLAEDADNQDEPDDTRPAPPGAIPSRRDLETEKFVQSLKSENAQLRKKNQSLLETNRQLEEKMRQHQLKYHSHAKAATASATNASVGGVKRNSLAASKAPTVGLKRSGESLANQVDHARRQHRDHLAGDLEMALKNRLVAAERQLVKLQHDNEQLRIQNADKRRRRRVGGENNNNNDDGDALSDGDASDEQRGDSRISGLDVEHLRRELRDRQAQVSILHARYENLETNAAAEREIQEQTIEQLEHMNRQVHRLRSQLQDTSLEKEDLEVRLAKAADLEREIAMLRDQNRKLEERMTSLCESPFINDAFQRKERIDKLFDLEKETQQQKATITRTAEENQKLQVIVKELQSNVKLMKQAKEMVEQDMDKLRQQLVEERNARSIAAMSTFPVQQPMQPAKAPSTQRPSPVFAHTAIQPERRDAASSPLKGEQPPSFANYSSNAMPMVTRRYPDPTLAGALARTSDLDSADANSVKHLRNRVHVLQLAHLKAIQELERCEKMLHAQTNINRELAQEIEELTTKNVSSSGVLQKRLRELELAADERQQRIQLLEAQNRQLKYAREKLLRAQENDTKFAELATSSDEDDDPCDVASVSESLVMAARDLSPGEQLLEIWVVGASFDRSVVSANASTFILCDFYDFESQSTPLLIGHRPEYNFSSTFKVTVDAFFLRYLASEPLVFELHQAIQGDFRFVGRASVSLAGLLRSKGVIKEPELPLKLAFGAEHDTVIGTLNVALRFAAPISEIWKLHLRSYPQDIQLLSKRRLGSTAIDPVEEYLLDEGFDNNQLKAVNELQITVLACRGLRSYGKKKNSGAALSVTPSPYVHYQILGFPDVFTNIVPSSSSPEFDLHTSKQFFAVEVDACLLHFFSKFQLWFTVFDDQVDVDHDSSTDGAIGRCGLLLDEIVKGESLRGWFQLRDRNDQPAGEISLLIEWKDPFQVAQLYSSSRRVGGGSSRQAADLHSLDYDQQHAIMRLFAPDMDGRVNYRQFLTYALPSESLELVTSKIKERLEYAVDTEQLTCVDDVFLPANTDTSSRESKLTEVGSVDLQKKLEKFGVMLKDEEYELLEQVFGKRLAQTNPSQPQKIQVHYLLQHINPRISCAERLLLHKIRHTLRVFLRPDKATKKAVDSPTEPFDRYDPAQSGFVSRAEFKRCLGVLGFELLDIDRAYKDFVEKESRSAAAAAKEATPRDRKPVDLDNETLQHSVSASQTDSQPFLRANTEAVVKDTKATAVAKPPSQAAPPVDPRTEFDRRKELFLERMKAIASSSAKSLVYEQLEKQKGDRCVHSERMNAANAETSSLSNSERVQQQLIKLHVPQALHHDAARLLQRQFRQYRVRQVVAPLPTTGPSVYIPAGSIVEIDGQVSRMLKTWTRDELEAMETTLLKTIERELPKARKDRVVSRKQLGFVLSKAPRVALEPELLRRLAIHFCVSSKPHDGEVAYAPLVHFICSVATDPKRNERPPIALMKTLSRLYVDAGHALETFVLAGDVHSSGCMSIKRFREALQRTNIQLPPKELRVLTVLLTDGRGTDVLYLPLIKILRDSPVAVQTREVVGRCARYGVAKLRETLLVRVHSDDGRRITREHLHSVLMQENAETSRFEPNDSYVLMELARPSSIARVDPAGATTTISIDELVLALERLATRRSPSVDDDTLSPYKLGQLQRLAMSCRTLLCPPYADMVEEFERFDWKETGLVTLAEFATIVPRIGFGLFTARQVDQVAKNFGVKSKGAFGINYRQFLDWSAPTAAPPDVEAIEAKLRKFVSDQSSEARRVTQILSGWRDAFAAPDQLSAGSVSRSVFAETCLETLRLPLEADELRTLLFSYDRNMDDCVDYGSFVQLNWKDTSRQVAMQQRKQVQFEPTGTSLAETVAGLRRSLLASHVTAEDVVRVLDGEEFVDVTQFIVCLKQLGASVSPDEARAVFVIHALQEKRGGGPGKLPFVRFAEAVLGLPSRQAGAKEEGGFLTKDDDERLQSAISSALRYSRKDFDRALAQLDEFCVVYDHGDIPARKLWKHMDRNGLVALLTKKAAGLLIQRCSTRRGAKGEDGESGDGATFVSLQAVSKVLREAARRQQPAASDSRSKQAKSPPEASSPLEAALAVARELVVSCEGTEVDVRGGFEDADRRYTGNVPALEFKSALLEMGLAKIVRSGHSDLPPETLVGLLVREFRAPDPRDGVSYAPLLARVVHEDQASHPLLAWFTPCAESLRARIRLRAGFTGRLPVDLSVAQLCAALDTSFAHFDRENKGFLTHREVAAGLLALRYDLSNDQVAFFLQAAGVFRHSTGNGGLSRMEFDAFVLDPSAALLLRRVADALYASSQDDPAVPCVAQLSRRFIARDQPDHTGVLPMAVASATLHETAQQLRLAARDERRLQILFDVHRDGKFAYKLFMKVMSQWQQAPPASAGAEAKPRTDARASGRGSVVRRESKAATVSTSTMLLPNVVRALYTQLSSVDYDSQIEIFAEYLRRCHASEGRVTVDDFDGVMTRIGLRLAADGLRCLRDAYARGEAREIDYVAVLDAIDHLHRQEENV